MYLIPIDYSKVIDRHVGQTELKRLRLRYVACTNKVLQAVNRQGHACKTESRERVRRAMQAGQLRLYWLAWMRRNVFEKKSFVVEML